jgi:hypothetical protein
MLQDQQFSATSRLIFGQKMGQYPVGGFVNTQVISHWWIMGQAHNCFPVFFLYHYLADHSTFTLHSRIWRSPFSRQYLVFHEIANINIICFLYWEWLKKGSTSSSFCALISCSLVRRSLLTYLIVGLRTGPSLIDLWSWTV